MNEKEFYNLIIFMKKIIVWLIISFILIPSSYAWLCMGLSWYLYQDTNTKKELVLERDKLSTIITRFPIPTFDTKYIRFLSDCQKENSLDRLKLDNFSILDHIVIFINILFYIFLFLILPIFLSKKILSNKNRVLWNRIFLQIIILLSSIPWILFLKNIIIGFINWY